MNEKSAYVDQNNCCSAFNQKSNINVLDSSKISPYTSNNTQAKYDIISVLYVNEINHIVKYLNLNNHILLFSKEKFSKIVEDFKEIFKNLNIDLNFYQVKNLNDVITKTPNPKCCIALIDILNNKNDAKFISSFLDLQNISAINFTNRNITLSNKLSIDVDFKKIF